LEQKKKALEFKLSNAERRSRTRRLIQKGALLEKYLDGENVPIIETEKLLKVLADFKNRNQEYVVRKMEDVGNNTED
jgi:hypothetical protein